MAQNFKIRRNLAVLSKQWNSDAVLLQWRARGPESISFITITIALVIRYWKLDMKAKYSKSKVKKTAMNSMNQYRNWISILSLRLLKYLNWKRIWKCWESSTTKPSCLTVEAQHRLEWVPVLTNQSGTLFTFCETWQNWYFVNNMHGFHSSDGVKCFMNNYS